MQETTPPSLPFASHILKSVNASPSWQPEWCRGDREEKPAGFGVPGTRAAPGAGAGAGVGGTGGLLLHSPSRGAGIHRWGPWEATAGGKVCVCLEGGTWAKNTMASTVSHLAERGTRCCRCLPGPPLRRRIIQLQNPPHSCSRASKQTTKVHSPILLSSITSSFAFLQLLSPLSSLFLLSLLRLSLFLKLVPLL